MSDWTVDEHTTAGGQSHFAEFVSGLTDAKDIKDAAVLTSALRALGNQLRAPRSKSLEHGAVRAPRHKGADILRILTGSARGTGRWIR